MAVALRLDGLVLSTGLSKINFCFILFPVNSIQFQIVLALLGNHQLLICVSLNFSASQFDMFYFLNRLVSTFVFC